MEAMVIVRLESASMKALLNVQKATPHTAKSVILMLFFIVVAAAQSWSSSPTPTTSQLPCPAKLFPNFDVVGTILSTSFQPDEATCLLNCCNVASLCVGYSFNVAVLGASGYTASTTVTSTSIARSYTAYQCNYYGGPWYTRNDNLYQGVTGGDCNGFSRDTSKVDMGGGNPVVSSGVTGSLAFEVANVRCVLLSNISQLIPSNGWSGGIKLSALGS